MMHRSIACSHRDHSIGSRLLHLAASKLCVLWGIVINVVNDVVVRTLFFRFRRDHMKAERYSGLPGQLYGTSQKTRGQVWLELNC